MRQLYVREIFLHKLGLSIQNDSNTIMDTLISADGQTVKVKGQVTATVNLQDILVLHTFVVIDGLNYTWHAVFVGSTW